MRDHARIPKVTVEVSKPLGAPMTFLSSTMARVDDSFQSFVKGDRHISHIYHKVLDYLSSTFEILVIVYIYLLTAHGDVKEKR